MCYVTFWCHIPVFNLNSSIEPNPSVQATVVPANLAKKDCCDNASVYCWSCKSTVIRASNKFSVQQLTQNFSCACKTVLPMYFEHRSRYCSYTNIYSQNFTMSFDFWRPYIVHKPWYFPHHYLNWTIKLQFHQMHDLLYLVPYVLYFVISG